MNNRILKLSTVALLGVFLASVQAQDNFKPLKQVRENPLPLPQSISDIFNGGSSSGSASNFAQIEKTFSGEIKSFQNFIKSVRSLIGEEGTSATYQQGLEMGQEWGHMRGGHGRHHPFMTPDMMHGGFDFERGVRDGYPRGFDASSLSSYSTTSSEHEDEFLAKVEKNTKLQLLLDKMQWVEHNDRCAEGVIEMVSTLLDEDVRKYTDWSDTEYTAEGYPCITTDRLTEMFENSDKFVQVDPNSEAKAFRVNLIVYPTLGCAHIEIMGPDGKWYSDGVQTEGSALNSGYPMYVTSYDLDVDKYLGYTESNPQVNSSYTSPFATFFATNPNTSPKSTLFE